MAKYSIGLDFGTLSGRALLLNLETGEELASAVCDYPHGVMDREMPWGEAAAGLGTAASGGLSGGALWDDSRCIEGNRRAAGGHCGSGEQISRPVRRFPSERRRSPVFSARFAQNPHAYVKLWKHHAAQDKADRITALARLRGKLGCGTTAAGFPRNGCFLSFGSWPKRRLSSTALCTAMWEAADWIVWQLTGNETCGACSVGYKAFWNHCSGYPAPDFSRPSAQNGTCGGEAGKGDLPSWRKGGGRHRRNGPPYRPAGRDSGIRRQCGRPCVRAGCGISGPGNCWQFSVPRPAIWFVGRKEAGAQRLRHGEDGILPGYFGFEAGEAVGGLFFLVFKRLPPASCREEAFARKKLTGLSAGKRAKAKPGESGLLGAGLVEQRPLYPDGRGSYRIASGNDPAGPSGGTTGL